MAKGRKRNGGVSKEELSAIKASLIRRYVEGKISKKKMMAKLAELEKLEKQKESGDMAG